MAVPAPPLRYTSVLLMIVMIYILTHDSLQHQYGQHQRPHLVNPVPLNRHFDPAMRPPQLQLQPPSPTYGSNNAMDVDDPYAGRMRPLPAHCPKCGAGVRSLMVG